MFSQARPLLLRAIKTGDFSELADSRLQRQYVDSEMFRMIEAAAACVRHSAPKRPRMVQVTTILRRVYLVSTIIIIFIHNLIFFIRLQEPWTVEINNMIYQMG